MSNNLYRAELLFPGEQKLGMSGLDVRRIQEWLVFWQNAIAINSSFDNVTENAVKNFQRERNLPQTGVVNEDTWNNLVSSLNDAINSSSEKPKTFAEAIIFFANTHLSKGAIEIGGDNLGPWIRTYMNGAEGSNDPWCAGFASYVMQQSANLLGIDVPIPPSIGCTALAHEAQSKNILLHGSDVLSNKSYSKILVGSLILFQMEGGWHHVGIVIDNDNNGNLTTIEGNSSPIIHTNNGYKVSLKNHVLDATQDFALLPLLCI